MLFFSILAGVLIGFISTSAEAKIVRYEFDVVSSVVDYQYLERFFPTPGVPGTTEYAAFVTIYHPLRDIVGQTGRVVFDVHDNSSFSEDSFTCRSGFLCPDTFPSYAHNSAYGFSSDAGAHLWALTTLNTPQGYGTLHFSDDGGIDGYGELKGAVYAWWDPRATFTLANLTITDVTTAQVPAPVPLPAAAWLLGLGMAALGLGARHPAA